MGAVGPVHLERPSTPTGKSLGVQRAASSPPDLKPISKEPRQRVCFIVSTCRRQSACSADGPELPYCTPWALPHK
eukprot:13103779-Alexandrium_andersonii.AAC.1